MLKIILCWFVAAKLAVCQEEIPLVLPSLFYVPTTTENLGPLVPNTYKIGNILYLYSVNLPHEKLSFEDAWYVCKSHGMSMVNVMDATEQQRLLKLIRRRDYDDMVWLGGYRECKSKDFIWGLNRKVFNYSNWALQEPNGDEWNTIHPEDCVAFHKSDGKWSDLPCNTRYYYLCRKSIIEDF